MATSLYWAWDFVRQHWGVLAVAALFAVACVKFAARLLGEIVRGAVLAARRPRALGESGAVMAEFVIVVVPFLLMLTALMQMALASMARVLVGYAAFCAARAAIVFVPADPSQTQNQQGASSSSMNNEPAGAVGNGANARNDFQVSKKAGLIRNAASYALIPASPSIDTVVQDAVTNWATYLEQRLEHGIDPTNYLNSLLGSLGNVPPGLLNTLGDKLKQVSQSGLSSQSQKDAAKAQIDSWLDGAVQGDPVLHDKLEQAANSYIDTGGVGSSDTGGGTLGNLLNNVLDGALGGPLNQFKDQLQSTLNNVMPGGVGTSYQGYAVDRALDVGFGSGTDGASGAILRSLRKLLYARMGTVITLRDDKGQFKTTFGWNDPIKVRVTYLFYCQIPIANRFAGKQFFNLSDDTVKDLGTGPMHGFETVGLPGFFIAMNAEHTLTNQGRPQ